MYRFSYVILLCSWFVLLAPASRADSTRLVRLEASDGVAGERFGWGLAVSGDTLLVGAPYRSDIGFQEGRVLFYERESAGSPWLVSRILVSPGPGTVDRFGISVDLDGDWAAIGSPYIAEGQERYNFGIVYLHHRNAGGPNAWGLVRAIRPDNPIVPDEPFCDPDLGCDPIPGDRFGLGLDLEGDRLVVAAPNDAGSRGAVYVFERNSGGIDQWGQVAKLEPSQPRSDLKLGLESVALDGDRVAAGGSSPNLVYVFERQAGGTWAETARLGGTAVPFSFSSGDHFGKSVALQNDLLVVGGSGFGGRTGEVHFFRLDAGGTWQSEQVFAAAEIAGPIELGWGLALEGDRLAVGGPAADSLDEIPGQVFLFERNPDDGRWSHEEVLAAPDLGGQYDQFGRTVRLVGGELFIGAQSANLHKGAVYTHPASTDPGPATVCAADSFDGSGVLGGPWQSAALGDAASFEPVQQDGVLAVQATGSSLYHGDDNGTFVYQLADGDFRIEVAVPRLSVDQGGLYRKAGVMARESLDPLAPRVMAMAVPHHPNGPSLQFDVRIQAGGAAVEMASTQPISGDPRLAIERRGDVYTAYYSTNGGSTWTKPLGGLGGSATLATANPVLAGVASSSYDLVQPVTFEFDDYKTCRPSPEPPVLPASNPCEAGPVDAVFVVDTSADMGIQFADGNRIGIAKGEVSLILEALTARNDGSRAALITYAGYSTSGQNLADGVELRQGLTPDLTAVDTANRAIDEVNIRANATSPVALALRQAYEELAQRGDASHHPVVIWVSGSLANIDGAGRGPSAYRTFEVEVLELDDGAGAFRSAGQAAWSGNFNGDVNTYDGEVVADAMVELQRVAAEAAVYPLVIQDEFVAPRSDDLERFAAYASDGTFYTADDLNIMRDNALALIDELSCGEPVQSTLGGVVWWDIDGDRRVDDAESRLAGVVVELRDESMQLLDERITGPDGSYQFIGLLPTTYHLVIASGIDVGGVPQPTRDPDGIGTPGTAQLPLLPGVVVEGAHFGYRTQVPTLSACFADEFNNHELDSGWRLAQLGDADEGSALEDSGQLTLSGDGSSLYAGPDSGVFLFREIEGDFRVEVDVDAAGMTGSGLYRKAGLKLRTGLGDVDRRLMAQLVPYWQNGTDSVLQYRIRRFEGRAGDVALGSNLFGVPRQVRLAVERQGNIFRAYHSFDNGETWQQPAGGESGNVQFNMPSRLLVGLDVVSYDASSATSAVFDAFFVCPPGQVPVGE